MLCPIGTLISSETIYFPKKATSGSHTPVCALIQSYNVTLYWPHQACDKHNYTQSHLL